MFILTDGKNFIMENPVKKGVYIATSTVNMAKEFTYKQARTILNNKSKKMSWIKTYYMVNKENGQVPKRHHYTKAELESMWEKMILNLMILLL